MDEYELYCINVALTEILGLDNEKRHAAEEKLCETKKQDPDKYAAYMSRIVNTGEV